MGRLPYSQRYDDRTMPSFIRFSSFIHRLPPRLPCSTTRLELASKGNSMSTDADDSSQLLPVVFGYNGRDLWFTVNFVIVGWLPLWLFPRWKYTPLVPIIPAMFHAVVYTVSIIVAMNASNDKNDLSTFDGVHQVLSDINVALPAWLHYCMADLLVGRWVFMDSVQKGASLTFHYLIMLPCLLLTCMLCPCGLLLYVVAIRPLLRGDEQPDPKKD